MAQWFHRGCPKCYLAEIGQGKAPVRVVESSPSILRFKTLHCFEFLRLPEHCSSHFPTPTGYIVRLKSNAGCPETVSKQGTAHPIRQHASIQPHLVRTHGHPGPKHLHHPGPSPASHPRRHPLRAAAHNPLRTPAQGNFPAYNDPLLHRPLLRDLLRLHKGKTPGDLSGHGCLCGRAGNLPR